jgi:hypothetical protein
MKSILYALPCFLVLMCERPSNTNESAEADAMRTETFSEMAPAMKSAPRPELMQADTEAEVITKKNIKTGGMTFKSDNIDEDYTRINSLLPDFEAYVENENQTKTEQRVQYDLTIRVPSARYDSLYNRLTNLAGRVEHKYTNVQDVTERYYDLQTRIKNKKALEQRYLDLLSKATAVKDMLEIERQLNEVRTEIENLQGQFNYLSNQVSLSTLQLSFYEVLPYTYDDGQRPGFGNRILSALSNGWQGMQLFVLGLITIWPLYVFVAFGILVFFLARKWWRRRQ